VWEPRTNLASRDRATPITIKLAHGDHAADDEVPADERADGAPERERTGIGVQEKADRGERSRPPRYRIAVCASDSTCCFNLQLGMRQLVIETAERSG
jgi:hypothetical protein